MFNEKIYLLRHHTRFSQERFAEKLGVSRQAVQRWENGTAFPDIDNLKNIARVFQVSIDWLLDLPDTRKTDSLRHQDGLFPSYENAGEWESYSQDLKTDYQQALDEGKDVEELRDLVIAVSQFRAGHEREAMADILFNMMNDAPVMSDFPYREPDDLSAIHLLRPEFSETALLAAAPLPDKTVLREKIYGAWLGRICGCMLGQPIECIKRKELTALLKHTGNWPMHRYITSEEIRDSFFDQFDFNLRDRIYADQLKDGFQGDDDTNYTIMSSLLVDRWGRNFTSSDVCDWWKRAQNMYCYATAEMVAYRNMIAGYSAPNTALYKNPFREWIGAQIRGDYFGYINPGDPEMAAEMAWRDARVSHVKNGVYGEMFVAAMLAAAFVTDDVEKVILSGMGQIPSTSRLFEKLQGVLDWFHDGNSWEAFIEKFHKRWNEYNPHDAVHTIPNAELVTAALLYGGKDYGKTICMAVQPGFDTDCNGATAGSVIGMMVGIKGIDHEWTDPVGTQCHSFCIRTPLSHDEMAERILRHIEKKYEGIPTEPATQKAPS